MRAVPLLAGCLIAAIVGAAAAQAAPEPAPPPELAPPPEPAPAAPPVLAPPSATEARDDPAWRLYDEAFGALLHGQRRQAAALAARLRREHAGHPAAVLVTASPLALVDARPGQAVREEPTGNAAAELALFQTLHGLVVGVELCVVFECNDAGAGIALSLAGAAGGALASLKAVAPVTSGQRALLNSGTIWGAFDALMAILAIDPNNDSHTALGMLVGQGAGLLTGALFFDARPTAGQVALANSGGTWGAVLMTLMLEAATKNQTRGQLAVSALFAADAGIAMGAYLATARPDISRAQTLVIDAGGIVGGVGGGGLGVLLSGEIGDQTTAAMAALGVAAGLGAAAYFTRDWNDPDGDRADGVHAVLLPAEHGRGGLVGLAGSW